MIGRRRGRRRRVGRHRIPDPEESSGGPPEGASDATESFDQPLVPPDDYPRDRDAEYESPAWLRRDIPAARRSRVSEPKPRIRLRRRLRVRLHKSDYPEGDYSDVPEYLQDGHREPEPAEHEFDGPATEKLSYAAPQSRGHRRAQHSGDWEGGEWTGSHRAIQTGRRGVSWGVIGALVAVVVVVAGFILWRFFGDALSNRSSLASARCVDGQGRRRHRRPVDRRRNLHSGQEIQRNRESGR